MIWYILAYLIGVIACWFLVAFWNDAQEYYWNKMPWVSIFFSWGFIVVVVLAVLIGLLLERVSKFKVFNPSLKYFKKHDKYTKE